MPGKDKKPEVPESPVNDVQLPPQLQPAVLRLNALQTIGGTETPKRRRNSPVLITEENCTDDQIDYIINELHNLASNMTEEERAALSEAVVDDTDEETVEEADSEETEDEKEWLEKKKKKKKKEERKRARDEDKGETKKRKMT